MDPVRRPDSQDSSEDEWYVRPERMMSIGTSPQSAMAKREQKASMVMTIVFFIIGLSVVLSYNWGATSPGFRPDAPDIIFFGVLVAAFIYIAARYGGQARFRRRNCTACGRGIPFDALLCPYCGF